MSVVERVSASTDPWSLAGCHVGSSSSAGAVDSLSVRRTFWCCDGASSEKGCWLACGSAVSPKRSPSSSALSGTGGPDTPALATPGFRQETVPNLSPPG